ncbi:hypothetical protein [Nocardia sp. NPDC051570]|uniref:hypothetical protein n=1 Tax=Nocardia sp. NPDC051570 TaxID=3364324 RepID=UPI0037B80688
MTGLPDWEQQLRHNVAEIRRNGQQLAQAASAVRGLSEIRGVLVEVDASGDITSLQIAPGAMRWTPTQLTSAILDCHRKARADAKTKVEGLVRKADPRIRGQLLAARDVSASPEHQPAPQSRTEEEIQAADDAYFERMNRLGWRTD